MAPQTAYRRARLGVCAALLAVGLGLGLVHTSHGMHSARSVIRELEQAPRSGGQIEVLHGKPGQFIEFVKGIVPRHAEIRIVRPVSAKPGGPVTAASCSRATSGPVYWWVVYALAPRASVCSPDTTWTVYFGIAPPPGGTVYRFSATYAVVRR